MSALRNAPAGVLTGDYASAESRSDALRPATGTVFDLGNGMAVAESSKDE